MPPAVIPRQTPIKKAPDPDGSFEALQRVFGPAGLLARALPGQGREFEERPQQFEMARAVAAAIRDKHHLLVEAGTGTGKSYAYLVPMILWAVRERKKVLIATHTKALQQQLVERDLPFLRDLFIKRMGLEFRYALCLGTGNYVCPRRLAKVEQSDLFSTNRELNELNAINDFAQSSKTGRSIDLSFEPAPAVWAQVNRESDLCLGRECKLYAQSFFYKARREQEEAQVLVANHHLLFAHLASGTHESGGVLPTFQALVIDEAHLAEDVASAYLGSEIVNLGLAKLIELVHSRKTGRTIVAALPGEADLDRRLATAAVEARAAVGQFFENLQAALNLDVSKSQTIRLRAPNLIDNCLDEPLARIETILRDAKREAERVNKDDLVKECDGYATRCAQTRATIGELLTQFHPGWVYWVGVQPRAGDFRLAQRVPRLALCGAPIDVAQAMQATLFEKICPVVLTSATLSTAGNYEFLRARLGLTDEMSKAPVDTLTVGSPFDYRRNALLYVARDLPDPFHSALFEPAVMQRAAEVVTRTQGRAFVLCTSFRMVELAAAHLRQALPDRIRVLKQGQASRGKLLADFRDDIESVLVGTTSFWQGVDVPGEALSCVVLMKLPFAVPDEPMIQARVESLRKQGRDPFNEYQVPQAVMMFRQGFGRLIRKHNDRGIVAVLDPRVLTKRYGRIFLDSLPDCVVTEDLEDIEKFAADFLGTPDSDQPATAQPTNEPATE